MVSEPSRPEEEAAFWRFFTGAVAEPFLFPALYDDALPLGVMNLSVLARLHRIAPQAWVDAIKRGALPVVRGAWQSRRWGVVRYALDREGVRLLHELWPEAQRTPSCPYCMAAYEASQGRSATEWWPFHRLSKEQGSGYSFPG